MPAPEATVKLPYTHYAPDAMPVIWPTVRKAPDGSLGIFLYNQRGEFLDKKPTGSSSIRLRIDRERYNLKPGEYELREVRLDGATVLERKRLGRKPWEMAPPTTLETNSNPSPLGLGLIRIQTSANWPAPPVCFL